MYLDIWRKGKALDLWSIPHFLFGILMAFFPLLLGVSLWAAFAITAMFAMIWEIYEKFTDIKETIPNSLIDILLPIFAFSLTTLVLDKITYTKEELLVVGTAIFAIYCFTNISGWLAYQKRKKEFIH